MKPGGGLAQAPLAEEEDGTNTSLEFSETCACVGKSIDTLRGMLASAHGLGAGPDQLLICFDGVPNVTTYTIQQQLANLRTSGAYARIIEEVELG